MTDRGMTRPLVLTVEPACTFASSEISAFHRLDVVKICSDYSSNYDQSTTADLLIVAPGYLGVRAYVLAEGREFSIPPPIY